jgi:hypothetical protein
VALERLRGAVLFRLAIAPGGLGFGPIHDRGPDVGLQRQVDVDHAEVVAVASRKPGLTLALSEAAVLLGLQNDRSGPVS